MFAPQGLRQCFTHQLQNLFYLVAAHLTYFGDAPTAIEDYPGHCTDAKIKILRDGRSVFPTVLQVSNQTVKGHSPWQR